jgi:hypothetical protein
VHQHQQEEEEEVEKLIRERRCSPTGTVLKGGRNENGSSSSHSCNRSRCLEQRRPGDAGYVQHVLQLLHRLPELSTIEYQPPPLLVNEGPLSCDTPTAAAVGGGAGPVAAMDDAGSSSSTAGSRTYSLAAGCAGVSRHIGASRAATGEAHDHISGGGRGGRHANADSNPTLLPALVRSTKREKQLEQCCTTQEGMDGGLGAATRQASKRICMCLLLTITGQ